MIKPFILGSTIAVLSALPALATDWEVTGVSNRTRETVAIDMDSIDRVSQYDVRFRYLIGKDLVQASVNCDSSLVTPNTGNPFVPDMMGATREMIKLACRAEKNNYGVSESETCSYRSYEEYRQAMGLRRTFVSDLGEAVFNLIRKSCKD